ncbi:MAG: thioesterase family protein [Chitinophagaceae bacterium]|nr:thioesterase family protein [Chitinophagaceae bacterium]
MERIKLQLSSQFPFSTALQIRITDINYGGHVGNDTFLSLIQEARQQFLYHYGYTELNFSGVGLIMVDAAIEYKKELNYAETVKISVAALNFNKIGFDLHYLLEVESNGFLSVAAKAKTGMLCYNYDLKKRMPMPEEAFQKLTHV